MSEDVTKRSLDTGKIVWSDFPKYWIMAPVKEWRERTWYGRLLFPFWILVSIFAWAVIAAMAPIFLVIWVCSKSISWIEQEQPEIYKNND